MPDRAAPIRLELPDGVPPTPRSNIVIGSPTAITRRRGHARPIARPGEGQPHVNPAHRNGWCCCDESGPPAVNASVRFAYAVTQRRAFRWVHHRPVARLWWYGRGVPSAASQVATSGCTENPSRTDNGRQRIPRTIHSKPSRFRCSVLRVRDRRWHD